AVSILAVDDEQNLLELLITVLGKRGFKVKTALNGFEALKLLDQESFQLALLDMKMGPLNGVQLLKEIKDRRPVIKVIMMTAYPTTPHTNRRKNTQKAHPPAPITKHIHLKNREDTIHSLTSCPPLC